MGNKMQERLTVSQLTRYIKRVFSFDNVLSNVCVTGEISNFKLHSSGHMYFTLKDEQSVIRCVMFKTQAQRLRFIPEDGLKVIVRGYVSIYESGSAEILSEGKRTLDALGKSLIPLENEILIQGHTDNVPINTPLFPSNWELSTKRATNVVVYLIESLNLDPSKLTATGNGEYRPIGDNNTAEGRQKNRRIEIMILKK
jgi:flagellar motor protein MotB